jgi:hypothetical protein
MAEEKKNGKSNGSTCSCMGMTGCTCGSGCGCGCGGHGSRGLFFLLRVLITIIILMMVFWFGLAVGRMSDGYGRGGYMIERGYGIYPGGVYSANGGTGSGGVAMPMMRINGATSTTTTGAPGSVQNY